MRQVDGGTDGGFSAFVAGQWRALLPTAHLLTGTDALAADLVVRGLAAARPACGRCPPTPARPISGRRRCAG
jgi:hypothetical protein